MKEELRQKLLYKRVQQSPGDKDPKDRKIVEELSQLPEFQKATHILMYLSVQGEVDLTKLFAKHNMNKKFVLPKVNTSDKSLTLFQVNSINDLEKGTFNIPEPNENNHEKMPPEKIDMVIVPGIAFARNGHRVGYGGGFYDRLLKKLTCPKIGVAYEFQIVENIEGEDHDETVDIIVTEEKIIKITP